MAGGAQKKHCIKNMYVYYMHVNNVSTYICHIRSSCDTWCGARCLELLGKGGEGEGRGGEGRGGERSL